MDKKPVPFIPIESLKTQRVEIYINDLQKRLQQLRNKHDTIFTECCDILKKIQEVSTETITKQQEIGRIISEFEELGLKDSPQDSSLKKALVQKAGDVQRLREKFEKIYKDNLNHLIVQAKSSLENVENIQINQNSAKLESSYEQLEWQSCGSVADEMNPDMWSTVESFYSLPNEPNLNDPESFCLEEN